MIPSYQPIRGFFEKLTSDALVAGGIPKQRHYFDNVQETAPSSERTWAQIHLSFSNTTETVIGCKPMLRLQGPLQCLIYVPKAIGMLDGENAAAEVLAAWCETDHVFFPGPPGLHPRTRSHDGPRRVELDRAPWQVISLSCVFSARCVEAKVTKGKIHRLPVR